MRASLIRHWLKSPNRPRLEKKDTTQIPSTGEESTEQSAKQASLDSDGGAISSWVEFWRHFLLPY
jgi:hypothetical protein